MLPRLSGIESMSCCSRAFSATAMHCRLLGGGTIVAIVRRLLDFPQLVNKEVWRLAFAVHTVVRVCKYLKFDIGSGRQFWRQFWTGFPPADSTFPSSSGFNIPSSNVTRILPVAVSSGEDRAHNGEQQSCVDVLHICHYIIPV